MSRHPVLVLPEAMARASDASLATVLDGSATQDIAVAEAALATHD
ncbi:hypothetical protein [Roseibium litorale]|nr:hypothetical protein [Roseibium litorale]